MNINDLSIYQGAIAFLWILFGSIAEETGANGFLDPARVFACRDHVQFVPVHNSQQLLTDILISIMEAELAWQGDLEGGGRWLTDRAK
jgi:hypothetical protein